jgi:hypothetical protein
MLAKRSGRWVIGLVGHSLVFACRSYDRAATRACAYARAQRVDVWRIGDDAAADRLARFRDAGCEDPGSRAAQA